MYVELAPVRNKYGEEMCGEQGDGKNSNLLLSSLSRLDSFGGIMVYPSELSEHKHN